MAEVGNLQEKRKRARKALAAFGRRARAACDKISTPEEFYEMINPLENILENFGDDLPEGMRGGLEAAMNITDTPLEGLSAACEGLTSEVDSALKILPKGGAGLGTAAAAIGVTAVAGVGLLLAAVNFLTVDVVIRNEGCAPIPLAAGLPPGVGVVLGVAGVDIPDVIPTDDEEVATVPPVTVGISMSADGIVSLSAAGQTANLQVPAAVQVEFNGQSLAGQSLSVDLGSQSSHLLVVRC